MATWIAMASMALEEDGKGRRKAPSVRPGQLQEMASMASMALDIVHPNLGQNHTQGST